MPHIAHGTRDDSGAWHADMLTSHGLSLIAEHVLVAPVGTAHKRMRRPWETCRTPTRVHQIVHVAVKGSRQAATRRIAC